MSEENLTTNEQVEQNDDETVVETTTNNEVETSVEETSTKSTTEPEVLDDEGFFDSVKKSINKYRKYNENKGDKEMKQEDVNKIVKSGLNNFVISSLYELIRKIKKRTKEERQSFPYGSLVKVTHPSTSRS